MIDNTPKPPADDLRDVIDATDPALLWSVLVNDPSARVALYEPDGRVLFANARFEQAYRRAGRASVVGLTVADLFGDPDASEEALAFMARVVESGQPLLVEKIHDGAKHHARLHPFPDPKTGRTLVLVISRNVTARLPAENGTAVVKASTRDLGELSPLTKRELEILALIGEGLSSAQIADRLSRSVKTIEWHRASIGSKLAVKSRVELARIAIRAGLTSVWQNGEPATSDQ